MVGDPSMEEPEGDLASVVEPEAGPEESPAPHPVSLLVPFILIVIGVMVSAFNSAYIMVHLDGMIDLLGDGGLFDSANADTVKVTAMIIFSALFLMALAALILGLMGWLYSKVVYTIVGSILLILTLGPVCLATVLGAVALILALRGLIFSSRKGSRPDN